MSCDSCASVRQPAVVTHASGVVRSDDSGKPDYTLLPLDYLERWALHMAANVESKGRDNWRLASTEDDRIRFVQAAWRHLIAWTRGDGTEDHAVAISFNVAGAEHVRPTFPRAPE